jgi:putative membrane protein
LTQGHHAGWDLADNFNQFMSHEKWRAALFSTVILVLFWSGVSPFDRLTWFLEVLPAFVGLAVIYATRRTFPLTPVVTILVCVHMVILAVGGKYTYALVPAGDWVRDYFGLLRNHYDRLGHLAQGFVPALIAREIFLRLAVIARRGWLNFLVVSTCLAISCVYELIEWATALAIGEASDSFLGTQGDVWDTQTDMFLAGVGAIAALSFLCRVHDRQLHALSTERKSP